MSKIFASLFIILSLNNILYAQNLKDFNFVKDHEVLYELIIGEVTAKSRIHNASGKMKLKVMAVCDGWVINQNTYLDITDKSGFQVRNEFRNSSWESFDFMKYKFLSQTVVNGNEVSYFEGEGDLTADIPKIIFSQPYVKEIILPEDAIFPMKHYLSTLKEESNFKNYTVFFGEDDESLNNVTSFTSNLIVNNILYKKVRSAVFNYDDFSVKPLYEIELIINSKGIVDKVIFDYLDYKIEGRIIELKELVPNNC